MVEITMGNTQLITYPDSLGGSLAALSTLWKESLQEFFPGGLHILPPFPSSGDRGFAPLSYRNIEPRFGSWKNIEALGRNSPVMIDLMVNHLSRQSPEFQDVLKKGRASHFYDLFIPVEKMWPSGEPRKEDLDKVFLRRKTPISTYATPGSKEKSLSFWTSFGQTDPSEQVDIDVFSSVSREFLEELFKTLSEHKISAIRLDAVGYVTKKLGTACFFEEPEIQEFLTWIRNRAAAYGITILPEVHAPLTIQQVLEKEGYWSYDFASPFLILNALISRDPKPLNEYLKNRPLNMITMLDCHDGIPVYPDIAGLAPESQIRRTLDFVEAEGANFSKLLNDDPPRTIDVHQINATYYSALGRDDQKYLAARAVQLFLPGTPQIYYVGLLAGENDYEAITDQQDSRAVNRHNYSMEEVRSALESPLVRKQLSLISLRNTHPAFSGHFSLYKEEENSCSVVNFLWENRNKRSLLRVDFKTGEFTIQS